MADIFNFNKNITTVVYNDNLGERQVMAGKNAMIVKNVLHPGFPEFKHKHPHEQIATIASGHCKFMIGDEWFEMGPGDMVFVPGDTYHDIIVLGDEPVVNYDIFYPLREDFLKLVAEKESAENK